MEKGTEAGLTDIRRYEEILAKDPSSYCFAPLSDLYRKAGRLDDALDTALRGCEMHPDYIGGYMALGRACFEKGLYEEGRQALEKVVRVMPDNSLAHQLLDEIELRLSETKLSDTFDTGILSWAEPADVVAAGGDNGDVAAPDEFEVEWDGGMAEDLPDDEEIIELTDEVIDDEEELPPPLYEYSDEAGVPVAEVVEPPASPLSTATIAELYLSQGFAEKALDIFRELLASDPGNDELRQRVEEVGELVAGHNREEMPVEPEEETAASGPVPGLPLAEAAVPVVEEPAELQVPAHEPPSVLETLEGWLANIRRLR